MTTPEPDDPWRDPLISFCEAHFNCQLGPPKAFFEIPQGGGASPVTVTYVSYVVNAPTFAVAEAWMRGMVLIPLVERAEEEGGDYGAWLYWRLKDCFECQILDKGRYQLRTRIAVLDRNLIALEITECMRPEGESEITI